jgi:hypothetical protein
LVELEFESVKMLSWSRTLVLILVAIVNRWPAKGHLAE